MFRPYQVILSRPGAWQFSLAGLIGRFPASMVGIGIILMVSEIYGEASATSYGMAGRVSAVFVAAHALCSPQLAKLIDRFGQARVMRPALAVACSALTFLIIAAVNRAGEPFLLAAAALGGASIGSIGALVRARWVAVARSPKEMHTAYSLESVLDEVTFVVGPVVATTLATAVAPWSGLAVPIVAALLGGYWFLSMRDTEPVPSGRRRADTTSPDEARAELSLPVDVMVAVAAVFCATGAIFGAVDVSVVAFAEEAGSKGLAGPVLAAFAGGSLVAGFVYGSRAWSRPLWWRFVVGACVLAVGTGMLLLANSLWLLAIIGFVLGLSIAPTLINGNALIQGAVPPSRLTESLSWLGAAIGVGVSLGAWLSGAAVDAVGSHGGFLVSSAAGATALVIALAGLAPLRRAHRRSVPQLPEL